MRGFRNGTAVALASLLLAALVLVGTAAAQPFRWPAEYGVPERGGEISEGRVDPAEPGFNPFNLLGGYGALLDPPPLVYRDWAGDRSIRRSDGGFNLLFAADIEELERDRDFVVTLREGWRWSDGVEITAADFVETTIMLRDLEVGAGNVRCAYQDDEPIEIRQLDRYRFRFTLPRPRINAIAVEYCEPVPMHVFGPVYEQEGAAAVNAMWGEDADPSEIVSGGPWVVSEIRPGERYAFARNPYFGDMVQAADGTPLPAADRWVIRFAPDDTQLSVLALSGALDIYRNLDLDDLRALAESIDQGVLPGRIVSGGPSDSVDFFSFNFNHPDPCKRRMFREVDFRRAASLLIDREALVQAATGGLGQPARMWRSPLRPFHAPDLPPLEHRPEQALELLAGIGFTERGADGVLRDPESGCRAEFELLYNEGNSRRGAQAQVMSQSAAAYGVAIQPRQVSAGLWAEAIIGTELPRSVESEAILWGLTGGDIDNPSAINVFRIGANLNAWNKSRTDVQAWELLLDQLTRQLDRELLLEARVEIYEQREALLRRWMPVIPLISPGHYVYLGVGNTLPEELLDTAFLKLGGPGNALELLEAPR